MANLINATDSLNTGRVKINASIEDASAAKTTADSVQTQLDTIILDSGTSDAEVVQSRVDKDGKLYATLKERLDSSDAQLEQKVDLSGSGQVGWANIAQDAREQIIGTTPPAVVGTNSVLTANVTDNAITSPKRTVLGEQAYMYTPSAVAVNFTAKTITFPSGTKYLFYRKTVITLTADAIVLDSGGAGTLAGAIAYNLLTTNVELIATASLTENHVVLGMIYPQFQILNFKYYCVGDIPATVATIKSVDTTELISSGFIVTRYPIMIDTAAMFLKINTSTERYFYHKNKYNQIDVTGYATETIAGVVYAKIPLISNAYLWFDVATNKIISGGLASMTETCILLGFIGTSGAFLERVYLPCTNYTINGKVNIPPASISQSMLNFTPTAVVASKWKNKTFVSFGDSITWYDGQIFSSTHVESGTLAKGYESYMREQLECTVVNKGYSGYDMTQIFSVGINTYDFTGVDAVTITSGANDCRKGVPVGTVSPIGSTFTTSTYAGALQASIEKIINANKNTKIYLITPIKGWYAEYNTADVPNTDPATVGVMNKAYADIMKEIGKLYSIPVCDWYYTVGFNDLNYRTYLGDNPDVFTAYTLHPKNVGFSRMAEILIPFLNNN